MINHPPAELAKHDLVQIADFLNASDSRTQFQAFDEAIQINSLLADAAVSALQNGPERWLVAERLPMFGSIIVEPLQALLQASPNAEVKVLASLVLLRLGSRSGVPILLDAIAVEPVERYASFIVSRLAADGISEAGELMIARLRHFSPAEVDLGRSFESNAVKDFVVSLLLAIQALDAVLPQDLESQFTAPGIPVEIASALPSRRKSSNSQ